MTMAPDITLEERTPSEADRIEEVRQQWLADNGGHPVRMEEDRVQQIAIRLIHANVQPTGDTIRYVNGGRGSPNIVHPALKNLFTNGVLIRLANQYMPARPDVPDELHKLWQRSVDLALKRVTESMAQRQSILDERSQQQDAFEQSLQERSSRLDAREADQAVLIAALTEQVRQAELNRQDVHQALQAKQSELEAALDHSQRLQADVTAAVASLQSVTRQHAEARQEIDVLVAQATTQDEALRNTNAALQTLRSQHQTVVDQNASLQRDILTAKAANSQLQAQLDRSFGDIKELRTDLRHSQSLTSDQALELGTLRDQLVAQTLRTSELAGERQGLIQEREVLREAAQSAERRIQALQDQLLDWAGLQSDLKSALDEQSRVLAELSKARGKNRS